MQHDNLNRAAELFEQAISLDAGARAAFLADTCREQPELLQSLNQMLDAHDRQGSFLAERAPAPSEISNSRIPSAPESPPLPNGHASVSTDRLPTTAIPLTEKAGTRIGPYKLLQQIGEGGFGAVFMAEQERPVRRRVALKIIKLGMDTRAVIARFEAERQALAMMDHPHIARVLDAGATDSGRPYFVMELVKGDPITRYCDEHKLPIRDRLELFAQVCNAVQHAHQKGVIHRDIKPGNVLVCTQDGRPHARVIDFGIAKATDHRLTEKTLFTEFHQMIGTPAYMSPEQAGGSPDIDTRTDIYSLGVLLYELLTGSPPFDPERLHSAAYEEMRRIIREDEPPKPSTRINSLALVPRVASGAPAGRNRAVSDRDAHSEPEAPAREFATPAPIAKSPDHPITKSPPSLADLAHRRNTDPKKLSLLLRGELDWIVMKTIEKDRARRYDAAHDLVADIRRFLDGQAIHAAPPSLAYRLRKSARRHRVAVIIGILLLCATGATTVGMLWAISERAEAITARESQVREHRNAELVAQFLTETMERMSDHAGRFQDTSMLQSILEDSAERINWGELTEFPEAEIRLRLAIGDTLRQLGAFKTSRHLLGRSLDLARSLHGSNSGQSRYARRLHSRMLVDEGDISSGLQQAQELADEWRTSPNDEQEKASAFENLAYCLDQAGRYQESLLHHKTALEMRRRILPEDHPDILQSFSNTAETLRQLGDSESALPLIESVVRADERRGQHKGFSHAISLNNLAGCLADLGRFQEAITRQRAALDRFSTIFPGDHPLVLKGLCNLGECLRDLGRPEEARPNLEAALAMARRISARPSIELITCLNNLASFLQVIENQPAAALPLYNESLQLGRDLFPTDHPIIAGAIGNVAHCLQAMGRAEEALPNYQAALEMNRRCLPRGHPRIARVQSNLGSCLAYLKRFSDAARELSEAEEIFIGLNAGSADHREENLLRLIQTYETWNSADQGSGHEKIAAKWRAELERFQCNVTKTENP